MSQGCDSELQSNIIYNAEFLRKGFKTDCWFHVSDVDEVGAAEFFVILGLGIRCQSPEGERRMDFFCESWRLSATVRFLEFRDRGLLVRRIFSMA